MFRETAESVWVESYREVDARLSNLQETVSNLRKRRTKLYQAHIDDTVPTDVFVELKASSALKRRRRMQALLPPRKQVIEHKQPAYSSAC
jgi:hypothetical protein